jgi:hypothetical protein
VISRAQFSAALRRQIPFLLMDHSKAAAGAVATYTLSDPRDVSDIRYIGQTGSPVSRYRQHVNKASPWLPDDMPWWVKAPKNRPLHEWIRELHADGGRFPVMVIVEWHAGVPAARAAERALIIQCIAQGQRILNVEAEIARRRPMQYDLLRSA